MGFISTATETVVEGVIFPPEVQPPGSTKTLFLGGAGIRGLQIEDKFVKFTSIGVYLEESVVPFLQEKWKNKSEQELMESIEFFREIVTGPFEKFIRVTMILPLTGQQYSEKVSENCVAVWKSLGIYSEAEGKAVEKFKEAFKDQIFPPGASILFTLFSESLIIGFTKDSCIPKEGSVRIENKLLAEAVLESIIGKNGVSPATRQALSVNLSQLLKSDSQNPSKETESEVSRAEVQNDGIPV